MTAESEMMYFDTIPLLRLLGFSIAPRSDFNLERCYPTLKICFVTQGKGIWRIDKKEYAIEKGDIFILNNAEVRAIRTLPPPEKLSMIILEFEPRFIWINGFNIFDSSCLSIFFHRSEDFENRIPGGCSANKSVTKIMLEIVHEFETKLPEYEQMVKVKILNILIILNRHFSADISKPPLFHGFNKDNITSVNRVIDYINGHIGEELSLEKLSGIAHMNPSYFSTLFKKYNGISLFQYILKIRISLAVDLLKASDYTVLHIANLCGFNTPANFYKCFRRFTGKNPSFFRKVSSDAKKKLKE